MLIASLLSYNLLWRLRLRLGLIATEIGSTHATLSTEQSVHYVESVFNGYKELGKVPQFHGRVAEVGPGDSAGVAVLVRHDGAEMVDLVDRYRKKTADDGRAVLEALDQKYDLSHLRQAPSLTNDSIAGVAWKAGQAAEAYFRSCPPDTYDFILSWAVMEHLYDPLSALRDMVRCLRSGGIMLHTIDFQDHNLFRTTNDELAWLRYPDRLWRRMTSHTGHPNRVLLHRYSRALHDLSHDQLKDYSILVTQLVEVGKVRPWRPIADLPPSDAASAESYVEARRQRFADEFQQVPAGELAVLGISLRAEKV